MVLVEHGLTRDTWWKQIKNCKCLSARFVLVYTTVGFVDFSMMPFLCALAKLFRDRLFLSFYLVGISWTHSLIPGVAWHFWRNDLTRRSQINSLTPFWGSGITNENGLHLINKAIMVLNVMYLKGKVQVGLKKYQGRKPFIKGWNESSKWRSLKQAKCCQDRGKINLNIRRCQRTVNDYEGALREQERGKITFSYSFYVFCRV